MPMFMLSLIADNYTSALNYSKEKSAQISRASIIQIANLQNIRKHSENIKYFHRNREISENNRKYSANTQQTPVN